MPNKERFHKGKNDFRMHSSLPELKKQVQGTKDKVSENLNHIRHMSESHLKLLQFHREGFDTQLKKLEDVHPPDWDAITMARERALQVRGLVLDHENRYANFIPGMGKAPW